ncbi:MAG: hypothetical protein ACI4J0_01295 [Huintestinicola sp.]|uniref:hypothetical protein n=1 Tax=Huintestinicola sp. TaxID=2981661 RepID=UPI003EFD60D6
MDSYMDKKELAIAGISEAELIKYYIMPDGVTGLLVIKGTEVFNLSAGEEHFDSLEQAAVRAYAACPEAAADDYTREILKGRMGADISPMLGQYESADGAYEKGLPFEKDSVSALRLMMEYYLEMIYDKLGYTAMFPSELKGYRRKYTLSFRLSGERKAIPFSYSEKGSCFEMVFGNVIAPSDSIKLSVKYSFGVITAAADVRCGKRMRIENTFDIIHKAEKLRIFDETEIVYDGSKALASSPENDTEEIKMLSGGGSCEMMKLPFGRAYCFYSDNKTEIIVSQKESDDKASFLYHSEREYLSCDTSIVTDSFNAVHEIFRSDGKMSICTHFLPTDSFSRGIYKQKYENRYFYRSIGGRENGS